MQVRRSYIRHTDTHTSATFVRIPTTTVTTPSPHTTSHTTTTCTVAKTSSSTVRPAPASLPPHPTATHNASSILHPTHTVTSHPCVSTGEFNFTTFTNTFKYFPYQYIVQFLCLNLPVMSSMEFITNLCRVFPFFSFTRRHVGLGNSVTIYATRASALAA